LKRDNLEFVVIINRNVHSLAAVAGGWLA